MNRSRSAPRALVVLAGVVAILATACGGSQLIVRPERRCQRVGRRRSRAAPSTVDHHARPDHRGRGPNGGNVVRWFIGIGSGGKPEAGRGPNRNSPRSSTTTRRQGQVYLSVEIYDNKVAADQLPIQIAAGNPPDIIGPVGVEGLNIFRDNLLDLKPLITSHNFDIAISSTQALSQLLRHGQGRRHDRRAVCDLSVLRLLQQEAVRRGQAAGTRRPRWATCTTASRGTWTPSRRWA